jgi:nicotinamide phosphoribosyltransferase
MFKPNALYYVDGYKIAHKKMLAAGTTRLYGTWIPRSVKYAPKGVNKIVSFGQQLMVRWLHDEFTENFFNLPVDVAHRFGKDMCLYLGMDYDYTHFTELHNLGYLPIRIKSLPEGVETDPNIPHMTFINTVDGFGWLTLFLETIISALAWKAPTAATIQKLYNRNTMEWVTKTDPDNLWLVPFLNHDFSARGLDPFSMMAVGLGHATSSLGSDTLITIPAARYYYDEPEEEVCVFSVNASEHSVSTTKIFTVGEQQMIADWLQDFPKGILSIVSDTFDLWKLITEYLPANKGSIMSREGKLVIRPDSGDPVDIICGCKVTQSDEDELLYRDQDTWESYPPEEDIVIVKHKVGAKPVSEAESKGVIEILWDIFGGTVNTHGYKVLDPHIGAIYGDSITPDRQVEIYKRLAAKRFATTNIVLGIGSYTYQMVTRDTLGFAAKGAWFEANGTGYDIYKDPVTDDGTKKSLKGLIKVNPNFTVCTQCSPEEESTGLLQTIYENGQYYNKTTLKDVRNRLKNI